MGVNLVPIVRKFSIKTEHFSAGSHDVQDGCVTPGTHRLMRFDFLTYNKGNADLTLGSPSSHPEWFKWSTGHGHYHLINFNEFRLYDATGNPTRAGAKQAFCLMDSERIDSTAHPTRQFMDCNANQGISAGWADLYEDSLPCQYVVIDGLPDGDYTLSSTTNAQRLFPEDTFGDNTIYTELRLAGDNVTVLPDAPLKHVFIMLKAVNEVALKRVENEVKAVNEITLKRMENEVKAVNEITLKRMEDQVKAVNEITLKRMEDEIMAIKTKVGA